MSEFTFADVVTSFRGGSSFTKREYSSSGIPVIAKGDVKKFGRMSSEYSRHITEELKEEKNYPLTEEGDLIVTTRDLTTAANFLGLLSPVPPPYRFAVNQGANILRLDEGKVNPRYLVYWTHCPDYRSHIKNHAVGSTQIHIRKDDFLSAPLALPPLKEQKAIAHILGTLDDKIELNQKMNQTLEEIARAIFKSWFVDFDPVRAKVEGRPTGLPPEISDLFPDELVDSEIGEIPKEWDATPFTETFEFFSGGTPKTSVEEYWDGNVPWFSIADLNASSPWVTETEKSITELGLSKCSAKLIVSGTTIITARGTVGKVALAGQDMAINQSCYAMAPTTGYPNTWLYLQTLALVERLRANAHGSVFDTITRKTFDQFSVLSAPSEVLKKFGEITIPIFERMKTADLESKTLSDLRNTLLPKLISGELCIPDAEKFLEEAGI